MKSIARHTWIIAAALYAAVALIFLAPVLLRGDVVIFGLDTLTEEYPMYWWGWTQIKETGRVPWWCPHLFGGYPFVATFSFCPFYPPQWLSLLMDFPAAYNWQFFLVLWMAGWCGYGGLRLAGWPRGLALAGGLLWMTCGHVVTLIYPGHLKKLQALVWVPLVWGGVAGALRAIAYRDLIPPLKSSRFISRVSYFFKLPMGMFVIAGAAMAMQLLAHHFQIFYFSVMMVGLYWLWMVAIGEGEEKIPKGKRRKIIFKGGLIGLLGAGLIAIGLSAIQMFPSMHMAAMSNRAGGVSFDEATITSYPPEELLEFALPQFWGDSARRQTGNWIERYHDILNTPDDWWTWILPIGNQDVPQEAVGAYFGRWNNKNPERLVSDYIGIVVIILAGIGLGASRRRERWFWVGLIGVTIFISVGSYTPIFKILWNFVPLLNRFRSPGTVMFAISWGLIMLALMGMEVVTVWVLSLKQIKVLAFVIIGLTILIAILLMIQTFGIQSVLRPLDMMESDADIHTAIRDVLKSISIGRALLILLAACWILGAIAYMFARPKYSHLGPKIACMMIGGLLVIQTIDMWDHTRPFVQPEPYTAGYARYLFDTPPDNYLASQPQPFRMIQYNNELATRFLARGLNSTHGLHPITFQKYFDILDRAWFYDSLFIHLYNQQYVIAREGDALPEGYQRERAGAGYQVGRWPEPLQHVWIPERLESSEGLDNTMSILGDAVREDRFYHVAVLEEDVQNQATISLMPELTIDDVSALPDQASAEVLSYKAGEIVVRTRSRESAWMVISEHAAPGWQAELDSGLRIRPMMANYFFQMIPVLPGDHTVRFRYRAPFATLGAWTSICSLIVIVLMMMRFARRNPRISAS